MTFDDFKKGFEVFGKIDSAEKLAICESQYQAHLLYVEDQKFFEPVTMGRESTDIRVDYKNRINQILSTDTITEDVIFCVVIPSFEPEYSLTFKKDGNKYTVTLVVLEENFWLQFYGGNKTPNLNKRISTFIIEGRVGDDIFAILTKTVIEARAPKVKRMVLDGVLYSISMFVNDGHKTVTKYSPDPDSESGNVVKFIENLVKRIS